MSYKKGDWVLTDNGIGGYNLSQVSSVAAQGYQISYGHYTTFWNADDCHKPPRSILLEKGLL